ncbi:MAG: aspartate aminotransferase family protein [Dehalococcoidia bacterium]
MRTYSKSQELYEQALKVTPGPQSNLAVLFEGTERLFITRGKGAHLWDADGNEYIDYSNGLGPGILGYGNKEYSQAIKKQLDTLCYLAGSYQSPLEIELANKFVKHVPCAERVRFALSGSEAVQLAIRLARAYTKRRYFIRFEGHYHGWLDNVLGGTVNSQASGRPFPLEADNDLQKTEGRDPQAFEQCFLLPWNDIEVLEKVLEKYGEEVAIILMEPILCNSGACLPRPGYMEKVRQLCTKYGILLSFDEIITGFRVGLSGAQGLLGVTPDIATFGKAVAGGVPFAAVAGKEEILELLTDRRVIGAGTFNGYPLGLAASIATISILEKDDGVIYKRIDKMQNRLINGLREISKRIGIPLLVQGPRGVLFAWFLDKEIVYSVRDLKEVDQKKQAKFRSLMLDEGVMILHRGRWYLSGALTEGDVDKTLECAERAMGKL